MYLKDPIKRVQYTFRIKEDLMEDLKVYAKAKNMKLPRLINDIIEEYLDGMNMSNTWSNEPLGAIITIPNEIPIKEHANVLNNDIDGLQYEVKAMPYNLDTWNDKYGYIANARGMKHKGVEPLLIPGLIKDIELKNDKATAQTIAQCLFALYFALHDNDRLHVEIISHNKATGQLQFINPDMAKIFVQYRKMLMEIIKDNLVMLNDVNHDRVKQQLLEQLEDLAISINTGNVVPIIAPAGSDNTLESDNPYLNGTKPKPTIGKEWHVIDNSNVYEDMQNRIDELERENDQYKTDITKLWEELNDINARQQAWQEIKQEYDTLREKAEKLDNIVEKIKELDAMSDEEVLERISEKQNKS